MASNVPSSVAVIEQSPETGVVEWNLDNWPEDRFIRLVPTQTLGIANEYLRPLVSVVQLDLETDTYKSNDIKDGHRAPNAKGLSKIAGAAGVNFVDEIRLDDGSDLNRAYVRVKAVWIDHAGMRQEREASRDYRLESQQMTDAQRRRAKGFVHEHAATRARHRALRDLFSLAQSYPEVDLRSKAFAVVRYVPNTQHPAIAEIYRESLKAGVQALFGGAPAVPPQLAPVAPIDVTPAATEQPTALPGESLARVESAGTVEPDWMSAQDPPAAEPKAEAPKKAKSVKTIVELLQEAAGASGLRGAMTEAQRGRLKPILGPVAGQVNAVLAAAFALGPGVAPNAAQANAIVTVADSLEADGRDFGAEWRAAAESAA